MYYECRKCNRRFEELKKLGKVKFCGDFWKCTDCDNDITKDLDSWYKESFDQFGFLESDEIRENRDKEFLEQFSGIYKSKSWWR